MVQISMKNSPSPEILASVRGIIDMIRNPATPKYIRFDDLRRTHISNGREIIETIPYTTMCSMMHQALPCTIEIAIEDEQNEIQHVSVPLLPVALVDVPHIQYGALIVESVPNFSMRLTQTGVSFAFFDDLLDFVHSDIHNRSENQKDDEEK